MPFSPGDLIANGNYSSGWLYIVKSLHEYSFVVDDFPLGRFPGARPIEVRYEYAHSYRLATEAEIAALVAQRLETNAF